MADIDIVKMDQGGVNSRILAKETKADFRRVEGASLKLRTSFASAEGKRMFVRFFSTFQLALHFISVIARTRLDNAFVSAREEQIREHMAGVCAALNAAIDKAEAQFQAHGITSVATYDTVPLQLDVGVLSSSGRRYLEILVKLDQLMPLLQTLEIHEVISTQAVDKERAALKRKVREVANGARAVATQVRREMDAVAARRAEAVAGAAARSAPPSSSSSSSEDEDVLPMLEIPVAAPATSKGDAVPEAGLLAQPVLAQTVALPGHSA